MAGQELQVGRAEAEPLDGLQQPPGAGHDAVPAAVRQVPGEDLEDGPAVSHAAAQRSLQHGELVVVGQQCGFERARASQLSASRPGRIGLGPGLVVHRIRHRWKTT